MLSFFLLVVAAYAQTYYPFAVDQDAVSGPADFSFLNEPLTPASRLHARNGHFYRVGPDGQPNTADDTAVRLYGVNLAFGANFPTPQDATRIARRLRRLGVNVVRLHHMDSQPDSNSSNAGSLLTTGPYPTLNPTAIERLRTFLTALAGEGIYANLNLHVGYQFRPAIDGIPSLTPAIPSQSKPLHIFYPRMVELQKDFVRKVLDALSLAEDPVLGMVEINNESSLLWDWQVTNLDANLNGAYLTELQSQWNTFLRARHRTEDALREAWRPAVADGAQILGRNWQVELHSVARASLRVEDEPAGPRVDVTYAQGGDTIIVKQVGFSVDSGATYLAEVELRADLPAGVSRNVYWDVKQDVSPWRTMNGRNIAVTNQWQKFQMLFTAGFAMDRIGRFGLSIDQVAANVQVRGALLRIAGERGMQPEESLGAVALVKTTERSSPGRIADFLAFLSETDRAYLNALRDVVREQAGPLVPIAGTQIGFGGLMTIDSHRDLDYHDNHFYVDHYNFPNTAWDAFDWRIRDASSAGSGLGAILNIAATRVAGMPFTVSEYNQNWPNRQAAELDPLVSIIGAFQDWDGLMHFAYSHGRGWDDGVPSGFDLNGDWTKWINFGQTAWLFRGGAISKGETPLALPASRTIRERATMERRNGSVSTFLSTLGFAPLNALRHRIELADREGEIPADLRATAADPVTASTGEFAYNAAGRLFVLNTPLASAVIGYANQQPIDAGAMRIQLKDSARGFVVALLTPSDNKPLAESRRLLLTLPGESLRARAGTTPAQPQRLVNYPGTSDWFTAQPDPGSIRPSANRSGGPRPTFMERIECEVSLKLTEGALRVYPLDGAGKRLDALDDRFLQRDAGTVTVHLQADGQAFSPWYEITIE
ncbi:MAG: hypothetical protein JST93_19880 [Acidobacteria bacterium]|nr:hypothetical protein [Acidobacteriota bacterium]